MEFREGQEAFPNEIWNEGEPQERSDLAPVQRSTGRMALAQKLPRLTAPWGFGWR
jgi:hypothetical protein